MKTSHKPVFLPGCSADVPAARMENATGIASVVARARIASSRLAPTLAGERATVWFRLGVPLLLGTALRIYHVDFGSQVGTLFSDELIATNEATKLAAEGLSSAIRPNGILYYLIVAPFLYLLSILRTGATNPRLVYDLPIFDRIVAGRLINVAFGAGTIIVAYLTACRVGGKKAGFWAALAVALSPSLVVETHFNATAPSLVFWFALMLYFLVRAQGGQKGAGYLAFGAAAAAYFVKPVGVVALDLAGAWAAWMAAEKLKRDRRPQTIMVAAAVVVACGALLALRWNWLLGIVRAFLFEYEKGTRPIYAWEWFLHHEGPFLILAVLGVLVSRLDRRLKWPLVIVALLYSLGTLAFRVYFVRWLLLLTPFIALFAGEALANRHSAPLPLVARRLLAPLAIVLALLSMWDAGALVRNLGTDAREGTWTWVRDHVPVGAALLVPSGWPSADGRMDLSYRTLVQPLEDDPNRYIAEGVNYLLVVRRGPDYYNWRAAPGTADAMDLYPALYGAFERVHTEEGTLLHIPVPYVVDILKVTGTEPYPPDKIVYAGSWHGEEVGPGGDVFRWTAGRGELIYNWGGKGSAERRLSLEARAADAHDTLDILVNGQAVAHVPMPDGSHLQAVETAITLVPGINRITLVSRSGCTRPVVVNPSSNDTRCLGAKVGLVGLSPGS